MKKRFDKIYVEITNVCNLNCDFCDKSTRENKIMSLQEFEKVIDKIKEYTNLITLHIKGEPLLHPELDKIFDIAYKNEIMINLTTNATLLNKKIDILKDAKSLRQINISLHAFEQNGLDIEKNSIEVIKAIKQLNNVIISYRLWNVTDISENDENRAILEILGREYNIENVYERSKNEKFIKLDNNVFLNQDIEFEWPGLNKKVLGNFGNCYALKKQIGILANGDVVPCCLDQNGDINLGNIFNQNLDEILNSEKTLKMIDGFNNGKLVEDLCKRCGFVHTRLKI